MNLMLTTVGAVAAVAKVASTAYNYAEQFGVFNREAKVVEAETRSVEVAAENQSADVGFLLSRIPVFSGSGYEIWSSMMKTFFVSQDLWDMVDMGYVEEELSVEVLREVGKRDAMALLFIQQAIDKSVFSCIAGASKSKEAWDALQKKYRSDAEEPNRQNSVDESSVLSCPAADATEFREAWDAPEQGYKAHTKDVEGNRLGKEFGVFNSNCGFKEGCSNQGGHVGTDGGRILIKNLDKAIDDGALHAKFSAFGNIVFCKVRTDASGRSKGYGVMEYDSEEAAQKAIEKVNGTLLNHKKVYVERFVSKQEMTKSTKVVYVANLSESTTKVDLREVFGYCGTIANTVVVRDGDGKSKCFGFVKFKEANDASWSIEKLNGHKFDNKEWCVRRDQKKSVKRAKRKSVDESVPSSTATETESKLEAVQKGYRANTRVLYVDDKGVVHFKLKIP